MERTRKPSNLAEGLRNTEIKRETDIRDSLGPESESERGRDSERMSRDTDVVGHETPGHSDDEE